MPSRDYDGQVEQPPAMSEGDSVVTAEWLVRCVRDPEAEVLVLDCRPTSEYHESHVRGAINVCLPASILMLRRLANGKVCLTSIIKDYRARETFDRLYKTHPVVLYDSDHVQPVGTCVVGTLFRRLQQDGCRVGCLQGGFEEFRTQFPEWCDTESSEAEHEGMESSLLGLESLRITPVGDASDSEGERCDSGVSRDDASPGDAPFPVEILPYLFLGNAENSTDLEALERHQIHYILNVTPNLPNVFEKKGLGMKYMQIPIQDHWSQNLASFFPDAIAFIEEARQKKLGVLVHCLAGISRSVTITLAYLMHKLSMPLNDAYDFVRQRKANISPNFNFMGQLMDFERQLNLTPCRCTCREEPCKCQTLHFISPTRSTPDSGIDIDRWT